MLIPPLPSVELGLIMGCGGRDIPRSSAMDHIGGSCEDYPGKDDLADETQHTQTLQDTVLLSI